MEQVIDATNMTYYITHMRDGMLGGKGKAWLTNARFFIGEFNAHRMHEGSLFERKPDSTYTEY